MAKLVLRLLLMQLAEDQVISTAQRGRNANCRRNSGDDAFAGDHAYP